MKNFLDESKISKHFGAKFHGKRAGNVIGYVLLAILIALFIIIFPAFTGSIARVNAVTSYDGSNPYITFDEKPLVSAHRAGGALAPENTMMAFKNCLDETNGFDADILEFDLHLTSDNKLILLHDDTVDRTSDSIEHFGRKKVYVKDRTLKELQELNMGENFVAPDGSRPYRGLRGKHIPADCKIVTLKEVLTYCENTREAQGKVPLNYIIEIKDGDDIGKKATDELYNTLNEMNLFKRVIVGTFQGEITKYMDEGKGGKYGKTFIRSASIAEVILTYYRFLFNVNLNKCDVGFEVLQVPPIPLFDMGQKSFLDYCHHYGIAIQFWTINDEAQMKKLIANGADCIITDNPKLAYDVINKKNK